MGAPSLLFIVVGIVLIAAGYLRFRRPYARYQALKEQDQNVARYNAWRGGIRDDSRTGASVAMQMLRRQAQVGGVILLIGFVLVVVGFFLK